MGRLYPRDYDNILSEIKTTLSILYRHTRIVKLLSDTLIEG